jgi:Tfp pilus assembly protein PilN
MMKKQFSKSKSKNTAFICSITETSLKVVKCLRQNNTKREFVSIEAEALSADADDKTVAVKLNQLFKKLEYKNNLVIVSLPRNLATCRYLKVPSQNLEEIGRIAALQAPHYLPYSAEELITAYQIVQTDKDGYSHINLVIAHKDVVARILNIFKELKPLRLDIVLSSYGLCNLYNHIRPQDNLATMIIDIDSSQIELAISVNRKLVFSRSFKLSLAQENWDNVLADEINKSRDAYLREVAKEPPVKIVVLGARRVSDECAQILNRKIGIPAEALPFDKISFSGNAAKNISESDNSFASLIGLGLEDVSASLNILPVQMKERFKSIAQRTKRIKFGLLLITIVLIWILGIAKTLDNKAKYLERLKTELNKISKEARPLEEADKRFKFMETSLQKKPSILDVLYELHQIMPQEVSLMNFDYEEGSELTLRGQAPELNSVFSFVSQLQKSAVFKSFNIKINHATKNKTISGEVIDFEIAGKKE